MKLSDATRLPGGIPMDFTTWSFPVLSFRIGERFQASMLRHLNLSMNLFAGFLTSPFIRTFVKAASSTWWSADFSPAQGVKCQMVLFIKIWCLPLNIQMIL